MKPWTVIATAMIVIISALVWQTARGPRLEAAGTCAGNIGMSSEINPGWDYLAIRITATGVTGCTQPQYEFAFWNGSMREVFRPYNGNGTAYWDTHNLVGVQFISIYVRDITSGAAYQVFYPWLQISLNSHG